MLRQTSNHPPFRQDGNLAEMLFVHSMLILRLDPMEGRLAFLLKGRDRLAMVSGGHGQHLIADRSVHDAMGELLEANIHRRFRPADRLRRTGCQAFRQIRRRGGRVPRRARRG